MVNPNACTTKKQVVTYAEWIASINAAQIPPEPGTDRWYLKKLDGYADCACDWLDHAHMTHEEGQQACIDRLMERADFVPETNRLRLVTETVRGWGHLGLE